MPSQIRFSPTSYEQLSSQVSQLNTKTSEIKIVESSFKFDDSVDGIKGKETSPIESALYASLVFGENKTAVMDGIYYFQRCILSNKNNGESYIRGLATLCKTATASFGVTDNEINEICVKAHYDHFVSENISAKKLNIDGREDLIETVARAYVTKSESDKNEIVEKAIALASQVPMPSDTYLNFGKLATLLVDPKLQKTILRIYEKAVSNDPTYKDEKYALAK